MSDFCPYPVLKSLLIARARAPFFALSKAKTYYILLVTQL